MTIMRQLILVAGLVLPGSSSFAGSMPAISGSGTTHPAPLSVPPDSATAVQNYVSTPSPKGSNSTASNEGRAEVLFGTMGEIGGKAAAGAISGAVGAAQVGRATAGAIAGGGTALLNDPFGKLGREAGQAMGRWLDPHFNAYQKRTGYDSRNDPRFNPWRE
jgi:hypothetical protein